MVGAPTGFKNDPLGQIPRLTTEDPEINPFHRGKPEEDDYLIVEASTFHLTPDYSQPITTARIVGQDAPFQIHLRGVPCELCIMSTGEQLRDLPKRTEQHFLLLARDRGSMGGVIHYLLLLEYVNGDLKLQKIVKGLERLAEGKTVMEVIVPEGRLDVLEELGMRMEMVVFK